MSLLDLFKSTKQVISFEGGPGDTIEKAIIIRGAARTNAGVESEYFYLREKYGQQGKDWSLDSQMLLQANDRLYDKMYINLADGTQTSIIFDVTDFHGKI